MIKHFSATVSSLDTLYSHPCFPGLLSPAKSIISTLPSLFQRCMMVSTDDFLDVGECGNSRYLFKDGKQVIVTGPLSIGLSSLPLLDDITRVEGKSVTYEKRYTKKNTIAIVDSDFPNIPRIDYHAMQHGTWSACLPIEFG